MRQPLVLLPLIAAAWACAPAQPRSSSDAAPRDAGSSDAADPSDAAAADIGADTGADPDAGQPPAVICPTDAVLIQYSLTPLANLPPLSAIDLPNLHPSTEIVSAGTGQSDSLRLDLCQDAAGPVLAAVFWRGSDFEVAHRYVLDGTISAPVEEIVDTPQGLVMETRLPPAAVIVEGLAAAIGGDLRPLRIRLVNDSGLLVVGHVDFVAAARGRVTASSIEYTSIYVVVGGLAPGDVFAGLRCAFGESPISASFRLGTADFEVEACGFLGGGETTGYRIHRLAIQDSSSELLEPERGRFEFDGEDQVDAVLNYQWNHHNACDSFHLALAHADYAASTAPLAGCGTQVPNAPPRSFDEPFDSPVLYRIRYHGGDWTDGSIAGCRHYLFCN